MSEIDAFGGVTEDALAADVSNETDTSSTEEIQAALVESPAKDSTADTGEEAKAADSKTEDTDTTEEGKEAEAKAEDELSDEDVDKQIDDALADPKTKPVWKNLLANAHRSYNKRLEAAESFKELGEPDAVREAVEAVRGLDAVEKGPNGPVVTVKPYVDWLFEKKGVEKAVDVLVEIASRPSPETKGMTLADEILKIRHGIDASRMPEIKQFIANGYRLQSSDIPADELELVREDLRDVYASLSQEERAKINPTDDYDDKDEAFRNLTLEKAKTELDKQRQEAADTLAKEEQAKVAEAEKVQKFNQEINEAAYPIAVEAGDRVIDGFVTALTDQTGLSEEEGFDLANRIDRAINGEGATAIRAKALLEKEGVTIDAKLTQAVQDLNETAGLIAYFRKIEDPQGLKTAEAKMADIERSIGLNTKKIIAAVAKHRADSNAGRIAKKNEQIDATQIHNRGIANGATPGIPLGSMPRGDGEILAFP